LALAHDHPTGRQFGDRGRQLAGAATIDERLDVGYGHLFFARLRNHGGIDRRRRVPEM
jgi:hypothetical protein